jgi:hypothetical protein
LRSSRRSRFYARDRANARAEDAIWHHEDRVPERDLLAEAIDELRLERALVVVVERRAHPDTDHGGSLR